MRKSLVAFVLPLLFACTAQAQACPNASTSVTIPLSGSTLVTMYDQSCDVLPGSAFGVVANPPGTINGTTAPAVTSDVSGLHFSANGAAPGTAGTFTITYNPNGQKMQLTFVVGAPVTAISAGTTTP